MLPYVTINKLNIITLRIAAVVITLSRVQKTVGGIQSDIELHEKCSNVVKNDKTKKKVEVPMMLLKEIREEVEDKKGKKSEKLLFKTFIEEDSLKISIKNKDCKEPIIVDINSIIGPYADTNTMEQIRGVFRSIYINKLKEAQVS